MKRWSGPGNAPVISRGQISTRQMSRSSSSPICRAPRLNSVEILLEKDFLALSSNVDLPDYAGYTLVYGEYEVGDYQRRFKLSDAIDREQIEAVVRDGVLQLTLPKAAPAKAKKISVRAG